MTTDTVGWKRMRFKKNKVWMAVDDDGNPRVQDGKVLIKYQLDQVHEYRVHPANVGPVDSIPPGPSAGKPKAGNTSGFDRSRSPAVSYGTGISDLDESADAVYLYTDGASSGNPGPSGIGVVLSYAGRRKELSDFIGHTTNNVAELEAIRRGLLELKSGTHPVRIFTDSAYAFGVLTLGWKARSNRELVAAIKDLLKQFKDVKMIKVKGHAGHPENERADFLATSAIQNRT